MVTRPLAPGASRLLSGFAIRILLILSLWAALCAFKIVPDDFVGFRPGRSAHGALRQVPGHIEAGYRYACDLDLAKFFDHVQHDVLMARVARKIGDKRLLALMGRYLMAGVLVGESIQAMELGTPQGGPLSPWLANILLDDLDKELEGRGHRFVRYADDLLILVKSQRAGLRVKDSVTRFLTRKLKLVVKTNAAKFLGFTFRGTKLRWSDRAFEDFKHQVRKLTGRSWGVSMAYRFRKLAQYVRGWMGYFGISDYYRPIPDYFAGSEIGRTRVRPKGARQGGCATARPVASTPGAHVLLETVALRAHQGQEPAEFGDEQTPGDPDGDQQQELLAPVADAGDPDRDDQPMAESPRADLDP